MPTGTELTTVSDVRENRSYRFTATDEYGAEEELIVVPCDEEDRPVRAFVNRCTHEAQRFDTGRGVAMRDGQIICPKHGSMFDACSGYCDNGDAADTTLPDVDLVVKDEAIFLTDDEYTFAHEGGIGEGDDDGPSSTSHIGF
ncbi:Ferredoxin subunit of nitrite reductase or a ring-hydroxylating dioxygenase [Halomicrobium zhouii]|uniref:Ferredoxin subunit of nitrite reductase or a ring-hydroxylating dioxygenase n=1 Tax=Halomicrobium zhouii TaxID=767519 RepID=A0A1I6LGJ9_9EURY|nr:Rieske 2Fe-2S domain-containing protein [Halomicrobium zhouii]SFS02450.1 Ferredoxin subunit of nitrite reductase or a ring-hydroxylating dioxygenase [Halomicrobium zhouii]